VTFADMSRIISKCRICSYEVEGAGPGLVCFKLLDDACLNKSLIIAVCKNNDIFPVLVEDCEEEEDEGEQGLWNN
jgi:hypothetical protein